MTHHSIDFSNLAEFDALAQSIAAKLNCDVGSDPVLRSIPTVAAFDIGAYLGVPLRMESDAVVGAICALSNSPRIWQEAEMSFLSAVADLAESQIERHVLRYEQKALSAALAENDAILTTLSETRGKALTVHNAESELVFPNSALRTDLHLSYQELLVLPRAAQRLVAQGATAGAIEVDLPGRPVNALHVEVSAEKNGLTLAEWRRDPSK